ncbi:MAG: leucine-rich repeat domain-containing protein [Muribaculaceae bacterium]|nr:leucine-rich repeat domain-containing protein [Muribaculaceae bacterium]
MKYMTIACLLLAGGMAQTASAEAIKVGNLYYDMTDLGLMVAPAVSGEYSGEISIPGSVEIDGERVEVAGVADYAFFDSQLVTSVEMASGPFYIGRAAFGGCNGMMRAAFPETLVTIGDEALWGCASLTDISGDENVTTMGSGVFRDCRSLEKYALPGYLMEVPEAMFDGCRALRRVELGPQVWRIGELAFNGCVDLENPEMPPMLEEIGDRAFSGCASMTSLEMPESLMKLGVYAFSDCSSLTTLKLSEGLVSLPEGVFSHTAVNRFAAPREMVEIGLGSFAGCDELEEIMLDGMLEKVDRRGFAGCTALRDVKVNNTLPPVIEISTFDESVYGSATLYVPYGCAMIYAQSPNWERFKRIVETDDFTLTSGVARAVAEADVRLYGRRLYIEGAGDSEWRVYDVGGMVVGSGRGRGALTLDEAGAYVVAVRGSRPKKIAVR